MNQVARREFVKRAVVTGAALAASAAAQNGTPREQGAPAEVNQGANGAVDGQRKQIAMLLYPGMTALDLIAPQLIFALLPGRQVQLVATTLEPVQTDTGVILQPTLTLETAPEVLEVLFVPGGLVGTGDAMRNRSLLAFLRSREASSTFVTSVCTGSLILGAAGLLRGYQATTHWTARAVLPLLGAEPVSARVVEDRNRITAGGVTSGLDFALTLAAKLEGEELAKALQLAVEYAPAPPFQSGTPEIADAATVAAVAQGELFKPFLASWLEAARHVQ